MSTKPDAIPGLWRSYRRMLEAAGEQAPLLRRSLLLFVLASVFEGLAFACFYPLTAALLAEPVAVQTAWFWLASMATLALGDALARWFANEFAYGKTLAQVNYGLRLRLGRQLRRMPLQALSQRRTGELGAILSGNVEDTVTPMSNLSAILIRTLLVPAVAIGATFAIDWRMALTMAAMVLLAIPVYHWRRRLSGHELHDLAAAHARAEADILEYIQGLPVLRAMSQTGRQARKLQDTLQHLRAMQNKAAIQSAWPTLVFNSLAEIGLLAVLALGVALIAQGGLSIAALAALLVIATRFAEPLSLFASITTVFDYMEAGFTRIEELLSIKPLDIREPAAQATGFDIRFSAVSFAYGAGEARDDSEQGRTALQNLTFSLPQRSMTALVGPSGSGKTTITRLIMRYADPHAGTIEIGGIDLRHMQPDALMHHISVVFQDVYLFNDSILENIRTGNPEADDAQVMVAAEKANCQEFITRLPDGYRTKVGDVGGSLSGGERQRISIARAILKDAPIVILDEPTAALDTESELAVQRAVNALVSERTLIVIAHRLSTIVGADQILVLDEGCIVERGRHEELLEKKGRYAAMWNAQQLTKAWQ